MSRNKIYLIGFMGSGKSTAGKKLAEAMGWEFTDMDEKVEERAGKTIPEIFSEHGESWFRQLECKVLRELDSLNNVVVSTGGGVPCHGDNMSFMKGSGLTVYLNMSPEQLKSRLVNAKGERPLIKGLANDDLLKYIETRLSEREPFYSQAEIIIDGSDIDYQKLIKSIRDKI